MHKANKAYQNSDANSLCLRNHSLFANNVWTILIVQQIWTGTDPFPEDKHPGP